MELNMHTIGLRIKNRRKELRLTQTDIKDSVGISSGNLSDIENGNRLPAASTLVQLANALECSIDWILTGESPQTEDSPFSPNGDKMEKILINNFRELPEEDKEELIEISEMKLRKIHKARKDSTESYNLTGIDNSSMVG